MVFPLPHDRPSILSYSPAMIVVTKMFPPILPRLCVKPKKMRPARNQLKNRDKEFRRRFGVRIRSIRVALRPALTASCSDVRFCRTSLTAPTSRPFHRAALSIMRMASFSLPTANSHRGDSGMNLFKRRDKSHVQYTVKLGPLLRCSLTSFIYRRVLKWRHCFFAYLSSWE